MSENSHSSSKSERDYIALVRQKAHRHLRTPGVTSVGVGHRRIRNEETGVYEETDELCILFTVAKKLAPETLKIDGIRPLPESIHFDDGEEVSVQVIERSFQTTYEIVSKSESYRQWPEISSHKQRRSRVDPVAPGVSVSHKNGTAGTIGAIVYDNRTGAPLLLSNWHVLSDTSGGTDDEIVQPGRMDSSSVEDNQIGRLLRSHLGLAGDCAVATIDNRNFSDEVFELKIVPRRVAKVGLGDKVLKSGRTTGVTYGVVTRIGVTANITYGGATGVRQVGCFEIRPNPRKLPQGGGRSAAAETPAVSG